MHAHTDMTPKETTPESGAHTCCGGEPPALSAFAADAGAMFTCPMHPDVQQVGPGACPVCGMALEAVMPAETNPEYAYMLQRLVICAVLTLPLMFMDMGGHMGLAPESEAHGTIEALLATPVVLWGGWPFWVRGVRLRNLNMFTLIALGVGVSYGYSLIALFFSSMMAHLYFESAAMVTTLVLLGQVLELKAREQTGQALRALLNLAPKSARLVEGNEERDVQLSQVLPGQFLRVRPGERVPVDGVIAQGESAVDQSMVTGESMPVARGLGDRVIGGTMNVQGSFIMQAEHVGAHSVLARIAALVASAQRSRAPIQKLADTISGIFVPMVLVLSGLTALVWGLWGPEPHMTHALVNAVAVLIIACPCALGLATPVSIMCGTGRGALAGVLVREAGALERLEKADVLVLDKTGTLTQGTPKLLTVMPTEGHSEPNLLRMAASLEQNSEHALSAAIVRAAKERGLGLLQVHAFKAVAGGGVTGIADGRSVAMGSEQFLESLHIPVTLRTRAKPYKSQGQTVIFVAMDGHCIGLLMLADPVKDDALDTLKALRAQGLKLVMMTGDSKPTAEAVARKLGIDEVEADVSPERKAELVKALQARGHIVAMAGDGVNDAPALAQADVGIAMGTGTDVAIASAGITLVSGELMALVRARNLSAGVMRNIRQNLVLAFAYNIIALPLAAGVLYPWFGLTLSPAVASAAMAASSLSVVGNALRLRKLAL